MMLNRLNDLLDVASNFFAHRKGLLPLIGVFLIVLNFIVQFFALGWVSESDVLLHAGVVISILGFMLAWAL